MKTSQRVLLVIGLAVAVGLLWFTQRDAGEQQVPPEAVAEQTPVDTPPQQQVAYGSFEGADNHAAGGRFEIVNVGGTYQVQFADDFTVDAGPDVWVYVSPRNTVSEDGSDGSIRLEKMTTYSGTQTYALPEGTDVSALTHVVLWCARFDTRMGIGELHSDD